MVACPKPPKIIRDPQHLRMVRQLPCCVSMHTYGVEAHHLLRTGQHAMARKSGDNFVLPIRSDLHRLLHDGPVDEMDFLAEHGLVDPLTKAASLWSLTLEGLKNEEWLEEGRRIIEQ